MVRFGSSAERLSSKAAFRRLSILPVVLKESTLVLTMSTAFTADAVADLLFGRARRELLALLFTREEQSFYLRELARLTGTSAGTAQRELRDLERVGLVSSHRRGRQIFYRANRLSPVFDALRTLLEQTMGAPDLVRSALAMLADKISYAGVYGSLAEGTLRPSSDIDVMVVGEVEFSEVTDALAPAEKRLGRPVNPTVYSVAEFHRGLKDRRHFLTTVLGRPLIDLIGVLPPDARPVARERLAPGHSRVRRGGRSSPRRGRPKSR
jgi:predicted nucleotidyltransferase/DNA-binding transcriptional ArsR family regulator